MNVNNVIKVQGTVVDVSNLQEYEKTLQFPGSGSLVLVQPV